MNFFSAISRSYGIFFRLLVTALTLCAFWGEASAMPERSNFYHMLQALADAPELNREAVEKIIGINLLPTSHSSPNVDAHFDDYYFIAFRNPRIMVDDVIISAVNYKEHSDASRREISIVVNAVCIARNEVSSHYSDSETIAMVPSDGGRLPPIVWILEKKEAARKLSFYFSQNDCLSYLTLESE